MSRPPVDSLPARVRRLRRRPRHRGSVVVAAFAVGAALALVHWLGYVVVGLGIAVAAPSPRWALRTAVVAGALASVTFIGWLWYQGALEAAIGTGILLAAAGAIPLALVLLGAAARLVG
ncbi:MAG: hypothetical protein ACLFMX_01550 [Halobacteriales archaeon]